MRNYIILNNQRSDEISGLIIQELAPISKPLQRTQVETIDGRDGDIVTPLGYAAYDKKITIGLYGDFDINEIIAYFATQGTAIFSNEPDKYYNYQILDQIDYERLVRYRVATVTMHVQPFKYSATEGTITVDSSDTVSDEGSDIALDGTAEAPFNVLRHKGNATQTTYTGKNILNDTTAQRTIPSSSSFNVTIPMTVQEGTYSFGAFADGVFCPESNYYTFQFRNGSTPIVASATPSTPMTLTAQEASQVDNMFLYFNSNFTGKYGGKHLTAMVCSGSTLGDYEPYTNGASPNPDYPQDIHVVTGDSTVKIEGKNQQPTSWAQDFVNAVNLPNIASIETFDGKNCLKYQPSAGYGSYPTKNFTLGVGFKENTQYTISFDEYSTASNHHVAFYYTDGTYSTYTATSANTWARVSMTSTAGKTVAYVAPFYTSGTTYIDISTIQLELGSSASQFEPHKEQSYVLPFGDTYLAAIGDYADEPVKVGDTWYIRRAVGKVVLDGTNATFTSGNNGFVCAHTQANSPFYDKIALGEPSYQSLCDHFTVQPNGTTWTGRGKCGFNSSGAFWLMHTDESITTVVELNTWLSTHPTTVYYALAEPTDEEITDQDLIDTLDGFYDQAHSYKGHTHITATAADGNAPAILSVEVGEDNESTVTNAGNTTSRPILTIYGQGDIGVYINDVEVLDIALGNEQYITLDSTEMDAYKDSPTNLKNRLVTGDYSKLALNAGANKIRFTGNVTKYEISKYSRWL